MSVDLEINVIAPAASVTDAVAKASRVAAHGLSGFWLTQGHSIDALAALQAVSVAVPGIGLGTAVVPIQGRQPMVLAQHALAVNEVADGRLRLGLGVSHQPFIEGVWGLSLERSVAQMDEYLDLLEPLLHGDDVDIDGDWWIQHGGLTVGGARPPRVHLSALGPKMLRLAGRRADGVITWLVGPRTLADLTVPTLAESADSAGRPMPELMVGSPICVTADPAAAMARAAAQYAGHGALPAYRSTLAREGLERPEELVIIGDRAEVTDRLAELAGLGASVLMADVFGDPNEQAATFELLAEIQTSVIDLTAASGSAAVAADQSTRA